MARAERQYADHSRPIRAFTFVVDSLEVGQRIDAVLRAHYPWHSRTHFRDKLRRGEIEVSGAVAKPATRLRFGDEVIVAVPVPADVPEHESGEDLVILYEDEHVVAVDKPSGMAAHPVGRTRHGTLINKLHARYRQGDAEQDIVPRLGHRLDRDTSGIILCVKNRAVDQVVTDLFTDRRVKKTYLAITRGVPDVTELAEGLVDAPIGAAPDADTRLHQAVRPDGQPSKSRVRVRRAFARHALVELEPLTGRTHQLRVHLQHIGHPIACDHLYGDVRPLCLSHADRALDPADDRWLLTRLALHAHRLELPHPVTGAPLVIESPLPQDLVLAVEALEQRCRAAPTQTRSAS